MEASFYQANRKTLLDFLPDNSAAVLFSGNAPRQSADAYYPFFCSRNFLYLQVWILRDLSCTCKRRRE